MIGRAVFVAGRKVWVGDRTVLIIGRGVLAAGLWVCVGGRTVLVGGRGVLVAGHSVGEREITVSGRDVFVAKRTVLVTVSTIVAGLVGATIAVLVVWLIWASLVAAKGGTAFVANWEEVIGINAACPLKIPASFATQQSTVSSREIRHQVFS